jgi:hypothetical protein
MKSVLVLSRQIISMTFLLQQMASMLLLLKQMISMLLLLKLSDANIPPVFLYINVSR